MYSMQPLGKNYPFIVGKNLSGNLEWNFSLGRFFLVISLFQISFQKIGLKDKSGKVEGLGEALTLKDAIQKMGDHGKRISYLKVVAAFVC